MTTLWLLLLLPFVLAACTGVNKALEVSTWAQETCKSVICPEGTHCVAKPLQCPSGNCQLIAVCQKLVMFPEICSLPRERGTGNTNEIRWYFNTKLQRCKLFTFFGGGGNANNFLNKDICQKSCEKEKECFLQYETGPCRAHMPRWYYSTLQKDCVRFIYGGCQGNGNNFETKESCMAKCEHVGSAGDHSLGQSA